MTDTIENIRKDREAGTSGEWEARKWSGEAWPEERWSVGVRNSNTGECVAISPRYADHSDLTDARRIARVPTLEAIVLAAAELVKLDDDGYIGGTNQARLRKAFDALTAALEAK